MKLEMEFEIKKWDEDSVEGTWHGNDDTNWLDSVASASIENWIKLIFENAMEHADISHPWVAHMVERRELAGLRDIGRLSSACIEREAQKIAVVLYTESGNALADETTHGRFVAYLNGIPR